MASVFSSLLSNDDLDYLTNHPLVLNAKASLESRNTAYFSVPLTESIRDALQVCVDLPASVQNIPMRWIKGDTPSHVDFGPSQFETTVLVYLNDSPGELVVDAQAYPIEANTAYVFDEGLNHRTQGTANVPRLLLGPMNELAEPVGYAVIYYENESDAINVVNSKGASNSYIVAENNSFRSWRIASSSSGTSPQNIVYNFGDQLNEDGTYHLYPAAPCFLEGTTVLCEVGGVETYLPVEALETGTLVKTSLDGFKPVVLVGKGTIFNPGDDKRTENRLYHCSPSNYPDLKDDLYITGCHSILESHITAKQKDETVNRLGNVFVTAKKYRLMACVDERATPWNSEGNYTIWHFA